MTLNSLIKKYNMSVGIIINDKPVRKKASLFAVSYEKKANIRKGRVPRKSPIKIAAKSRATGAMEIRPEEPGM